MSNGVGKNYGHVILCTTQFVMGQHGIVQYVGSLIGKQSTEYCLFCDVYQYLIHNLPVRKSKNPGKHRQ